MQTQLPLGLRLLPIIRFLNELDKTLADGRISFLEAIGMIPETAALSAIWPQLGQIKAEYLALEGTEQSQLLDYIADQLQLNSHSVEVVIVNVLDAATSISTVVQATKTFRK